MEDKELKSEKYAYLQNIGSERRDRRREAVKNPCKNDHFSHLHFSLLAVDNE